jgi:hypothetical protein
MQEKFNSKPTKESPILDPAMQSVQKPFASNAFAFEDPSHDQRVGQYAQAMSCFKAVDALSTASRNAAMLRSVGVCITVSPVAFDALMASGPEGQAIAQNAWVLPEGTNNFHSAEEWRVKQLQEAQSHEPKPVVESKAFVCDLLERIGFKG